MPELSEVEAAAARGPRVHAPVPSRSHRLHEPRCGNPARLEPTPTRLPQTCRTLAGVGDPCTPADGLA